MLPTADPALDIEIPVLPSYSLVPTGCRKTDSGISWCVLSNRQSSSDGKVRRF